MTEGGANNRAATQALANLAEGIQGLVQHMRAEQQMIRDWVEAQAIAREGSEAAARPPHRRQRRLSHDAAVAHKPQDR